MLTSTLITTFFASLPLASAFSESGNNNVAIYWGQNSVGQVGSQQDLAYYCNSDASDIVLVSFLAVFFDQDGLPSINLGPSCAGPNFPGTNLLNCPDVGQDIKFCQSKGKKVLMSLGGAAGMYGFDSDAQATEFANTLWDLFAGGSSDTRPFGDAVVDGFDLDIEGGSNLYYNTFVDQMRSNYAADSSKKYYISGAPQCPIPDYMLNSAMTTSDFDFYFVQFYNNYCGLGAFGTDNFNFGAWDTFAKTQSKNPNAKVYLGVPGGPTAAGSGYLDADQVVNIAKDLQSKYSSFGGVSIWDASQAWKNDDFADQVKAGIDGVQSQPSVAVSSDSATSSAITLSATTSSIVISSAAESSAPAISSAAESSAPAISSAAESSAPAISSAAESSAPAVSSAAESSAPVVSSAAKSSAPVISSAAESSTPVVSSAAESSAPVVSSAAESSAPVVSSAAESSAPVVSSAAESSAPVVSSAAESSAAAISSAAESSIPVVSSAAESSALVISSAAESSAAAISSAAESSIPVVSSAAESSAPVVSSAAESSAAISSAPRYSNATSSDAGSTTASSSTAGSAIDGSSTAGSSDAISSAAISSAASSSTATISVADLSAAGSSTSASSATPSYSGCPNLDLNLREYADKIVSDAEDAQSAVSNSSELSDSLSVIGCDINGFNSAVDDLSFPPDSVDETISTFGSITSALTGLFQEISNAANSNSLKARRIYARADSLGDSIVSMGSQLLEVESSLYVKLSGAADADQMSSFLGLVSSLNSAVASAAAAAGANFSPNFTPPVDAITSSAVTATSTPGAASTSVTASTSVAASASGAADISDTTSPSVASTSSGTGASTAPTSSGTSSDVEASSTVTTVVTAFTTYCPEPTTVCPGNGKCYTVTEATTLVVTDCPCTLTTSTSSATPGGPDSTPGGSGSTPGNSGSTPGDSGSTSGNSGSTPGGSGSTPGSPGSTPGNSGSTSGGSSSLPAPVPVPEADSTLVTPSNGGSTITTSIFAMLVSFTFLL